MKYTNTRKLKNIQESNIRLEKRYLTEQAPAPPAPGAPGAPPAPSTGGGTTSTGSTPSNRTVIKPMVKTSGPKSIKEKNGNVIDWKKQNDQQKLSVANKCGHKTVEDYEKSEWKCVAEQSK
jgi:hypothetical protein